MQGIPLLTSAHLLAQLPDAVLIANTTGHIQWWNDAAAELYGWAASEMVGRALADMAPLPPPGDPHRSPQRWECEVIHRHQSGSLLPVAISAQRLYQDDGAPIGTIALIRPRPTSAPVSMHAAPDALPQETSDAVDERAQNLQALIDSVDVLLWSVDTSYRLLAANAAFRRAASPVVHTLAQADAPNPADTPGEVFAVLRTWYDRAFAGQETSVELPLHIAQQPGTFECSVTPLRGPDGAITGAAVFAQDVAARLRTEAAARDTQNKLGTLFEFLPVGVAIINADGEITYTNREHQRIAPGAYDHLEGGQPLRLGYLRPDGTPRPRSEFASVRALQERQPVIAQETGIVDANGVVHWVSITSVPVEMPDWRVVTLLTDITARKEAEAAVQAHAELLDRVNAQLNHALRLKDEFLATMSHELRTPLNAILGRTEVMQEQIYGPLTPRQVSALQSIEEAGRHLLMLINDILDLSKIEAGKFQLELAPLEIEAVTRASVHMVSEAATRKQIAVSVMCDDLPTPLVADERRLKQILVNLLSNAVKFTPKGGTIGLEVRGDQEAQTLTCTVWDTGIGIAPEDQLLLFQPFVQLDSGLAREHEGTGLGLALVQRLTERHGGSVILESEVGVGSRFHVVLPWRQDAATVTAAPLAPPQPSTDALLPLASGVDTASPLVLLVEDNVENVALMEDYLTNAGYRVLVAGSGAEAVVMAEAKQPDLILMDIQMPVMDGLEATRRIRAAGMTSTPIIAVTALAMRGDRERCLAAGASAYLTKPVRLRALTEMIEQMLHG
jgi:PAS domain S-box-containing protein